MRPRLAAFGASYFIASLKGQSGPREHSSKEEGCAAGELHLGSLTYRYRSGNVVGLFAGVDIRLIEMWWLDCDFEG